ncbi:MAG: cation diffusion facilitator family transporter [Pseudomonadota bacterium]
MHHHSHSHEPSNGANGFNLAFALAVGLNLAFTLIEAIYATLANSMSLLADAGHNLGDVLGLTLAWGAALLVNRRATRRYSYGLKRTTILAAITNALILVATSAIIAYESIYKLLYPANLNEMIVIIVALIGILINGSTALLFMRGHKEDLNIKGAFLHLAYDALISFGVVIGGIIILLTGWVRLDPIIGLMIVVTILLGTWGLLRDSVNLLLDAVPDNIELDKVAKYLSDIEGVSEVHDLHIWGLSTNEIALTAHLIMPEMELNDNHYKNINHDLKEHFRITHVTLQIERGNSEEPCEFAKTC